MRAFCTTMLLLASCDQPAAPEGLAEKDGNWPFPSAHHVVDGRVAFPDGLPAADTPVPTARISWREGFSRVQTSVVRLQVPIDGATLPGLAGPSTGGSVQMWDLNTGEPVPCFAELDAYPELPDEERALMIRPLMPMPVGHRVAVVVTDEVMDLQGQPLQPVPWFAELLSGVESPSLTGWSPHYQALVDTLEGYGVSGIALAFDFPIGDGTAPLTTMLSELQTPSTWDVASVDDDGTLPLQTYKRLEGTFETTNWLGESGMISLDEDMMPVSQGSTEAFLYIHIPPTAAAREPGTAPVWIFGHGIFSNPGNYMNAPEDESGVLDLAERAGAIVISTVWRGLTTSDVAIPFNVASDFGTIPVLTEHLAQGVANTAALVRLVTDGDLLSDPALEGLADRDLIRYYGISLGGIEGAVLFANEPRLTHGVFHVGGSTWSTMLERSTHWSSFEGVLLGAIPDAAERQLLYAVSQLFWDPIDPANYVEGLSERSVLWQVAVGDDQVPNLTTYTLARGTGAALLTPSAVRVESLEEVADGGSGPVIAQFDPMQGNDEDSNRPARDNTSHEEPRTWEGAKAQVLRFLDDADPGVVLHACGETVCAADNTGGP